VLLRLGCGVLVTADGQLASVMRCTVQAQKITAITVFLTLRCGTPVRPLTPGRGTNTADQLVPASRGLLQALRSLGGASGVW